MALPAIGTKGFQNLHWKDQLSLVRLAVTDPDKYQSDVLGEVTDKETKKIVELLAFLMQEEARQVPRKDEYPLTFKRHWIACRCLIDKVQCPEVLDRYGIESKWFFSTRIMKIPLLILSKGDPYMPRAINLLYGSRLRAATHGMDLLKIKTYLDLYKEPVWKVDAFLNAVNKALVQFESIKTLDELLALYTVVHNNGVASHFCSGDYLLFWEHRKGRDAVICTPLFPRELMTKGFSLRSWNFLI